MDQTLESSLLDGEFLYPFEDELSPFRVRRDLLNSEMGAQLIDRLMTKLLIYDQLVIPTVDLVAAALLVLLIGPVRLTEYARRGTIRFLRYKGAVMYYGGGKGLAIAEVRSPGNPPPGVKPGAPPEGEAEDLHRRLADAASQDVDEALDTMFWFFGLADHYDDETVDAVRNAILDATEEVGTGFFGDALEETYLDVRESKALSRFFSDGTLLKRLPGLNDNQMRWLQTRHWNDEIDVLLHLAQVNIESQLAVHAGVWDQTSGPSAVSTLRAKADRVAMSAEAAANFAKFQTLTGLPDLSRAASDDGYQDALLGLRDTDDAERFRLWFHNNVGLDPEGVSRAYVELLEARDLVDVPLARTLRFIVTSTLGLGASVVGGPAAGLGLAALDSLVADRFLRPSRSPKIFVSELRDLEGRFSDLAQ